MLFTWDTTNLCIVFKSWHIRSTAGLVFSLLAVVLIGMGYEALRSGTRRYELAMNRRVDAIPSESLSYPTPRSRHEHTWGGFLSCTAEGPRGKAARFMLLSLPLVDGGLLSSIADPRLPCS